MRVNSINSCQQKSNQNFKGLWGSERKEVIPAYHSTPEGIMYFRDSLNLIYKDYYPFLDDTKEEIYKAQSLLKSKNYSTGKIGKEYTYTVIHVFVEKQKLPFTAKNYKDYISDKLAPKAKKLIEEILKSANLYMYIKK